MTTINGMTVIGDYATKVYDNNQDIRKQFQQWIRVLDHHLIYYFNKDNVRLYDKQIIIIFTFFVGN